ncbi:MAG: hypothetical protein H6828_09705 [Planctomycetes bacterium]|nr:hypothetical protein [Planctomycetota bacterium]
MSPLRSTLALLVCFVAAFAPEELRYEPRLATPVTATLHLTRETAQDGARATYDGEEQEREAAGTTYQVEERLTVVDEVRAAEAGRATVLGRRFTELARSTSYSNPAFEGELDETAEFASPLAGRAVRLERDEDGAWSAALDDEGELEDDAVLAELAGELTLASFLPDAAVERGDSWTVAPERLFELFEPLGGLAWTRVGVDASGWKTFAGFGEEVPEPVPEYEGEVRATFAGRKKVDGVAVAIVELEVDVVRRTDTTANQRAFLRLMDPSERWTLEAAEYTVAYEGSGRLLWDRKEHRAVGLELALELVVTDRSEQTTEEDGEVHRALEESVSHGRCSLEFAFE